MSLIYTAGRKRACLHTNLFRDHKNSAVSVGGKQMGGWGDTCFIFSYSLCSLLLFVSFLSFQLSFWLSSFSFFVVCERMNVFVYVRLVMTLAKSLMS